MVGAIELLLGFAWAAEEDLHDSRRVNRRKTSSPLPSHVNVFPIPLSESPLPYLHLTLVSFHHRDGHQRIAHDLCAARSPRPVQAPAGSAHPWQGRARCAPPRQNNLFVVADKAAA